MCTLYSFVLVFTLNILALANNYFFKYNVLHIAEGYSAVLADQIMLYFLHILNQKIIGYSFT